MQIQPSPLKVIFNPPGVQLGMPGDTLQLYAIVINQGNQSAVIDVFFDAAFQILSSVERHSTVESHHFLSQLLRDY